MEASGSALESRGDSAFNALGLVKKVGLSVKCESTAQRKAKNPNAYFHFLFSKKFRKIFENFEIFENFDFFKNFRNFCIGLPIENFEILEKSEILKNLKIFDFFRKQKNENMRLSFSPCVARLTRISRSDRLF